MQRTSIEWCTHVANPLIGCRHVSSGCDHCYAEAFAARLARMATADTLAGRAPGRKADYHAVVTDGAWNGCSRFRRSELDALRTYKSPAIVFVGSMTDLWYDGHLAASVTDMHATLECMRQARDVQIVMLTKRPDSIWPHYWPPHCWIGVSAEDQQTFDLRWQDLCDRVPEGNLILSTEPMLGPIDISTDFTFAVRRPQWVIAGPETGPGARPCNPAWIEDLADQCADMSIPFFDKRKRDWLRREFPAALQPIAARWGLQ